MNQPHFVGHAPSTTPTSLRTAASAPRGLPDDLLRDASRRLSAVGLSGAIIWIVAPALDHLALHAPLGPLDLVELLSALGSFGFFLFMRRSKRDPAFLLEAGIGFQLLTAAAIALLMHLSPIAPGFQLRPVFTWIGIVVLLFAALVPRPPLKTAVISFISVSFGPLAMLLSKARGMWDYGSDVQVLVMHYPDYMLVGIAALISHVMITLGRHVTRARELGSYKVGELLGQGGMGEVYRATHRMLARPAAIKLIRPETLSGKTEGERELAVRRFHREAEAAANLRCPNTVQLYDFGQTDDQTLYFVMELLEGMNLDALVRRFGPLPPNRVVHILRQACDSLEEAHQRGLIHRDIKPANLHIGRLGLRHDFVKVLDFGLVKSVGERSRDSTFATEVGRTPGTPDYMAPEVTLGENVDARADLYALGCVAYFLLTGTQVFEAANSYHAIARHLNDIPVPPSQRAGIAVPAELERLLLACLAKKPDERPVSAAALESGLAAVGLAPWTQEDAAAWWRAREASS